MKPAELATLLRAWAAGHLPSMAAVELLIAHGHWLRREVFLNAVTVSPLQGLAFIDWAELINRLDTGEGLHDTRSELGILEIACSFGDGRHVDLQDALTSLDQTNVRLVAQAVLTAGGASVAELEAGEVATEWGVLFHPDAPMAEGQPDEQAARDRVRRTDGGTVVYREVRTGPWTDAS